MGETQVLTWHSSEPPKRESRPLLFKLAPSSVFEVLTWVEHRQAFCVGTGGWGDDRYAIEDLAGAVWAELLQEKG